MRRRGEIAQLVEHTTENRGVPGSSPGLAITGLSCNVFFWGGTLQPGCEAGFRA